MSIYDKGSMKTAADVVALMQYMLTPESFERWRALFPDSRIEEFIEEYLDYDQARGWEDEVFDDPDQQQYVMSEEYWEENFGNDPTYSTTTRYVNDVRHGDSDSKFTVGYPEPHEPSEWDLEPEQLEEIYGTGIDSSKKDELDSSSSKPTVQNARVEQTPQGTWVVRGDSERFGKDAILYEDYKKQRAVSYLHKLNKSESAKNMAKSRYKADLNSDIGSANLPKEFEYQVLDYRQMRRVPKFREAAEALNRMYRDANDPIIPDIYVSGMSQAKAAGKDIIFENEKGVFRWDESKKQFVPLNSSKGNMRVRASVNCARHQHAITCLNCAVSEVTVPTDFVRTESRAFDLMMVVQNELWDKGMDVTIKQLYRPQSDTFRFSYIITDPTTTDEQVDAAIEEIVGKLVQTGFIPAEAYGDLELDSSEGGQETTEIFINLFDKFPSKKLWECVNWLEHEMWAEGWDASIESADQPKPDQISLTVSHPSSISDEDIDDFIKDRVLEFIENDYERFVYPETDPRSKYNASLSCSVDWVSGDGNAFYLVDDSEDDGWGDPDKYEDYKVETDEYGNDVVHYEGYVITGNERIGYVALSPYGTWSPTIYRSITDAVDDVDRDIATKSQARA